MGPSQANTIDDVGVEHPTVADVEAEEVASQVGGYDIRQKGPLIS